MIASKTIKTLHEQNDFMLATSQTTVGEGTNRIAIGSSQLRAREPFSVAFQTDAA